MPNPNPDLVYLRQNIAVLGAKLQDDLDALDAEMAIAQADRAAMVRKLDAIKDVAAKYRWALSGVR